MILVLEEDNTDLTFNFDDFLIIGSIDIGINGTDLNIIIEA
jgi:hypothetical protein